MKKALQVASVASMIDQFNMNNIKILQELGYKVDIVANFEFGNTSSKSRVNEFKNELINKRISFYNLLFDRKIFKYTNIKVYKQLKKLIDENNYELIHCHSPIGGVITRLASIKARKNGTKVIYTAHGFHFFKGASLINWILYYPIEWLCSWITDTIITINHEDYKIAQNTMKAKQVIYIPGIGVNVDKINNIKVDKKVKRDELKLYKNDNLILSIGELSKRKNHEVVIRALAKIDNENIKYIICGKGSLDKYLKNLSNKLGVSRNVIFLGFRNDIYEICKSADIFIFPSLQEGLPVALMEAMASGLPVICSDIRGNSDLIVDNKGGYLFKVNDIEMLATKIDKLVKNKELCREISKNNLMKIKEFDISNVNSIMKKIYGGN